MQSSYERSPDQCASSRECHEMFQQRSQTSPIHQINPHSSLTNHPGRPESKQTCQDEPLGPDCPPTDLVRMDGLCEAQH